MNTHVELSPNDSCVFISVLFLHLHLIMNKSIDKYEYTHGSYSKMLNELKHFLVECSKGCCWAPESYVDAASGRGQKANGSFNSSGRLDHETGRASCWERSRGKIKFKLFFSSCNLNCININILLFGFNSFLLHNFLELYVTLLKTIDLKYPSQLPIFMLNRIYEE